MVQISSDWANLKYALYGITLFAAVTIIVEQVLPKGKIQLLQHNLTLFKPKIYCFIALRRRKTKILLCDATRRGEENQRQGGE